MENILLSPEELAQITEGYWENLPNDLNIKFINYRTVGVKKGDLHVSYNENDWRGRGSSEQSLDKVFSKGAVAAVVRIQADINTVQPILRVENTKKALKAIGLETSKQSPAIKVLVTGSFGKTGFKTQLHHLIHKQIRTNAVINSANKEIPIWRALGSIRTDDQVAIIEVAVPAAKRGRQRSRWVRPDICIITDIGLEHIRSHGGHLENVIKNKSEVVKYLSKNGKVIIPHKEGITEKLVHEIKQYGEREILTFGYDNECDAQLLSQKFNGFGWNIKARVADEIIYYNLPLLEEYAPMSSLAVLLTAHLLGADLYTSVAEYDTYQQYGSSGHLYQLKMKQADKTFYLYDQSKRGEMDAFKSTLRLIGRMQAQGGGRKIAILSEFTNLEEADKSVVNIDEFRQLVDEANIDLLYTTHFFSEHIQVLSDKMIWKNHSFNIDDIIPEIIENIEDNDIVFVRGTLKSNLKKLVDSIFKQAVVVKQFN